MGGNGVLDIWWVLTEKLDGNGDEAGRARRGAAFEEEAEDGRALDSGDQRSQHCL